LCLASEGATFPGNPEHCRGLIRHSGPVRQEGTRGSADNRKHQDKPIMPAKNAEEVPERDRAGGLPIERAIVVAVGKSLS
jgi:hypothetical protein